MPQEHGSLGGSRRAGCTCAIESYVCMLCIELHIFSHAPSSLSLYLESGGRDSELKPPTHRRMGYIDKYAR